MCVCVYMFIYIPRQRTRRPSRAATSLAPRGPSSASSTVSTAPSALSPPPATRDEHKIMIVYPRETPLHTKTARAQPPAAHRRRHTCNIYIAIVRMLTLPGRTLRV